MAPNGDYRQHAESHAGDVANDPKRCVMCGRRPSIDNDLYLCHEDDGSVVAVCEECHNP